MIEDKEDEDYFECHWLFYHLGKLKDERSNDESTQSSNTNTDK